MGNKKNHKNTGTKPKQNTTVQASQQLQEMPSQEKSIPDAQEQADKIGNRKLLQQTEKLRKDEMDRIAAIEKRKLETKNNSSKKKNNAKQKSHAQKNEQTQVNTKSDCESQVKISKPKVENTANSDWNVEQCIQITSKETEVNLQDNQSENSYREYSNKDNVYQSTESKRSIKQDWNNSSRNLRRDNSKPVWKRKDSLQRSGNGDFKEDSNIGHWDNNFSDIPQTENRTHNPKRNNSNQYLENTDQNKSKTGNWRNFDEKPYSRPNYSKNYGNFGNKYDNRSRFNKNDEWNDEEFTYFQSLLKQKTEINHGKLHELKGDLFTAPEDYSLAHCVAEDMSMGAGIAKTFRSEFGQVGYLLNQKQRTGGLAVLPKNSRFIYYLVTKQQSRGKPTLYTLWQSLQKLKQHIEENKVTKLALPTIGCGLDRLDWDTVKQMLEHVFKDVDIKIDVYIWDDSWLYYSIKKKKLQSDDILSNEQNENSFENISEKPQRRRISFTVAEKTPQKLMKKCAVINAQMKLTDIEPGTGLLYFGTVNEDETEGFKHLAEKYNIAPTYKTPKVKGDVLKTVDGKEYIYGLIIKESINDEANFEEIEKAIRNLRNLLKKDETFYVGLEGFIDKNDKYLLDKIIALMQYIFLDVEIWICWPDEIREYCPQQRKTFY